MKVMSLDPRYHSSFPQPEDLGLPHAPESPRGVIPVEPLATAARAVAGLTQGVVVAAYQTGVAAVSALRPRARAAEAVRAGGSGTPVASTVAAPLSGGLGTGNPDIDPEAAREGAEPGHGRMDVMGEKQFGHLAGAATHTHTASEQYARVATPRGSGLKHGFRTHAASAVPRRGLRTIAACACPLRYGGGDGSMSPAKRGVHGTAARAAPPTSSGGGSATGGTGHPTVPLPESTSGLMGAAEALLQEAEAAGPQGDLYDPAFAATIDSDVPIGPSAADEDYAMAGTKSAPRDARWSEVTRLAGSNRPAVLSRSDDVDDETLDERMAHIRITLRLDEEEVTYTAEDDAAAAVGPGESAPRGYPDQERPRAPAAASAPAHRPGSGGGAGTVTLTSAEAIDAVAGLGLAPEDVAYRPELAPDHIAEATAVEADRAKGGTALWHASDREAHDAAATAAPPIVGRPSLSTGEVEEETGDGGFRYASPQRQQESGGYDERTIAGAARAASGALRPGHSAPLRLNLVDDPCLTSEPGSRDALCDVETSTQGTGTGPFTPSPTLHGPASGASGSAGSGIGGKRYASTWSGAEVRGYRTSTSRRIQVYSPGTWPHPSLGVSASDGARCGYGQADRGWTSETQGGPEADDDALAYDGAASGGETARASIAPPPKLPLRYRLDEEDTTRGGGYEGDGFNISSTMGPSGSSSNWEDHMPASALYGASTAAAADVGTADFPLRASSPTPSSGDPYAYGAEVTGQPRFRAGTGDAAASVALGPGNRNGYRNGVDWVDAEVELARAQSTVPSLSAQRNQLPETDIVDVEDHEMPVQPFEARAASPSLHPPGQATGFAPRAGFQPILQMASAAPAPRQRDPDGLRVSDVVPDHEAVLRASDRQASYGSTVYRYGPAPGVPSADQSYRAVQRSESEVAHEQAQELAHAQCASTIQVAAEARFAAASDGTHDPYATWIRQGPLTPPQTAYRNDLPGSPSRVSVPETRPPTTGYYGTRLADAEWPQGPPSAHRLTEDEGAAWPPSLQPELDSGAGYHGSTPLDVLIHTPRVPVTAASAAAARHGTQRAVDPAMGDASPDALAVAAVMGLVDWQPQAPVEAADPRWYRDDQLSGADDRGGRGGARSMFAYGPAYAALQNHRSKVFAYGGGADTGGAESDAAPFRFGTAATGDRGSGSSGVQATAAAVRPTPMTAARNLYTRDFRYEERQATRRARFSYPTPDAVAAAELDDAARMVAQRSVFARWFGW